VCYQKGMSQAFDDNLSEISEHPADDLRAYDLTLKSLPALSEDLDATARAQIIASEGVPLKNGVESLSPELVLDLVKTGKCILVDVRGADRACGLIEGARHIPAISMNSPFVARLPGLVQDWSRDRLIVFFCQFCKHRAPYCANLYREETDSMQRVAVIEGGFRAWQTNGLPVKDGGGTTAERAAADALALRQGQLIVRQTSTAVVVKSQHLGG